MAGDAGVSGISGSSSSSMGDSLSAWGGAPIAAAGGVLLKALGLTKCPGGRREDIMGGGLSGRGAAAGVLGVVTLLDAKSTKHEIASRSISSSLAVNPLVFTFRLNGESEWGLTTPLSLPTLESEEADKPLLPPYPGSIGGAEGCAAGEGGVGGNSGYNPLEVLGVTRKKHYTL